MYVKEEFEVRVLKEMGNNAIALLKEAMKAHPELAKSAQLYLCQVCTRTSIVILIFV